MHGSEVEARSGDIPVDYNYSIRHDTKMCLVGDYPIVSGNESKPLFRNRNLGCVDAASTANTWVGVLVPSPAK